MTKINDQYAKISIADLGGDEITELEYCLQSEGFDYWEVNNTRGHYIVIALSPFHDVRDPELDSVTEICYGLRIDDFTLVDAGGYSHKIEVDS